MRQIPVTQKELDRLHAAWESSPESRSFAPLADAYHRSGRNEEAIELLHNGTARHPDYLSALVLLADCYQALGRTEEADAIFDRVLAQDTENLRALEHQAARSIQQGALGNAAAIIEQLRQMDPWDATIQDLAIQLDKAPSPARMQIPTAPPAAQQARRGPIRSVERDVYAGESAAAAVPDRADVALPEGSRDELSTLTLAQIYESQGYLQKALSIYDELYRQHPDNEPMAQRRDELRRRLAGVDDSGQVAPADERPAATRDATNWRLMDSHSLESLAENAEPPAPPSPSPPPRAASSPAPLRIAPPHEASLGDAAASGDEDFQRFLRYVRSLGR